MKRTFLTFGMMAVLAFGMTFTITSCGNSDAAKELAEKLDKLEEESKYGKGNWSEEDKTKANDAVDKVKADLEVILGDQAQGYIDCYLEKVENEYDSFASADSDKEGCEQLAKECMQDLMDDMEVDSEM